MRRSFARSLVLFPFLLIGCDEQPTEVPPPSATPAPGNGAVFNVSASGTSVYQFSTAGEYADAGWSDWSDGASSGFLHVARSASRTGGESTDYTHLYFSVYRCDAMYTRCTEVAGWGSIPPEDFTGTRLETNTASNPDFFTYTCTWGDGGGSCEPGGGAGVIDVEWTPDRFSEMSSQGTWRYRSPNFNSLWNGSYSSRSATATGEVVGWSFGGRGWGGVGTSHGTQVYIYRN